MVHEDISHCGFHWGAQCSTIILFLILLIKYKNNSNIFILIIYEIITPCKAEQPLRGMELPEKEAQKD